VRRKKKINNYPTEFRKLALEWMKTCRNVSELSAEPGVHRTGILCVERADKGSFFIGPEVLLHGGNPYGGLDIRYETAYRFPVSGLDLAEFVYSVPGR